LIGPIDFEITGPTLTEIVTKYKINKKQQQNIITGRACKRAAAEWARKVKFFAAILAKQLTFAAFYARQNASRCNVC